MTMQRQDYLKVSKSLRMIRDQSLEKIDPEDMRTRTVIRESYRALTVQLARAFLAVNPRFQFEVFFRDALGHDDGLRALETFKALVADVSVTS